MGIVDGSLFLGADGDIAAKNGRREEGLKPVVITLWDWLELVIVAAGTADGEAEEREGGRIRHVIERILPPLRLVAGVSHIRAE